MSDLSPRTRDLITRGRGGPPSSADRARVRAKLDERLALAAAAGAAGAIAGAAKTASATTAATATTAMGLWLKIGLAALVLGASGITFQAIRTHRAEVASSSSSTPSSAGSPQEAAPPIAGADETALAIEPPAPAASDDGAASENAAPAESADASPGAVASPSAGRLGRPRDPASIAAELALLRRAQSALAKGDPDASLRAIDAIEAAHKNGALREETSAARVLALCAAGKKAEAKAEAARFLAQWPSSVQAGRVRGSCAFAADPGSK